MKPKIMVLTVIFVFLLNSLAESVTPSFTIEATPRTQVMRVGQPFVFKLKYKFEQPRLSPDNGEVRKYFRHSAYLDIKDANGDFSIKGYKLFPIVLDLEDSRGLEYSGYFLCFYHLGEKRLLFPVPGRYSITVRGWRERSELLFIDVEPASASEQLAINLLSDANDFAYLEIGEHEYKEKRSERVAHLEQIVQQCEGTVIAKWAAGRLGLEYFKQFGKKYKDIKQFKAQFEEGQITEPLFDKACEYLNKGAELADEFPIRPEVLNQLVRIEYIRGDYEKAIAILDELKEKYPKTKYGKRTDKAKAEFQKLLAKPK